MPGVSADADRDVSEVPTRPAADAASQPDLADLAAGAEGVGAAPVLEVGAEVEATAASDAEVAEALTELPDALPPNTGLPAGLTALDLARHFAPIWYQDTANGGPDGIGAKMDVPTRVDFDGDLVHGNNWDNLPSVDVAPALYYALVATETHYFFTFSHYHARDWEQLCLGLTGACHEGDMESAGVVVRRDETGYGGIELVWTHAHGVDSYWTTAGLSNGKVALAGGLDFEDDAGTVATSPSATHTHVRVFSEAHGHGLAPCWAQANFIKPFGMLTVQCPNDEQGFPGGDGLKLVPGDAAPVAYQPGMQDTGAPLVYALEPVETTLWAWRSDIGEGALFRPEGAFSYAGARGVPFATQELLGAQYDPEQFLNDDSSGKPPWVGEVAGSAPSDPFLDPAWAFGQALPMPDPWSLVYTYHPYLPAALGAEAKATPAPVDPTQLTVRFLGVGGFSFRFGDDHFLTAPLYTNPPLEALLGGADGVVSDPTTVESFLDPDSVGDVSAILVGHAHYDHLLDVPYVWTLTANARIYGNLTTANLLAGFAPEPPGCPTPALPPAWALVPQEAVVALNVPGADLVDSRLCAGEDSCTGPWSGSAGAWVAVPGSHLRLRALCSMHPDQFLTIHFAPGCIDAPLCAPPTKADAWVEGSTLAYLVDFLDPATGAPVFRVYYQDAPTDAPVGHVPQEVLAEKRVDLAVLNVGNYDKVADHPGAILADMNPRYALGGHWEDFFKTQAEPLTPIPFMDLPKFVERLDTALPDDGTAPLLVNGKPEATRGWVPQPGDEVVVAGEEP